jgi:fructose-specific component phosphotransferase system IIB-like protein
VINPQAATPIAFFGVPLALLLTLLATVVVGLLSAATAVLVVWRSNANSRRNQREQLERNAEQFAAQLAHDSAQLDRRLAHEADQRDRERTMSLRREVYLEAAEALAHANTLLGRMSDIENDQRALGKELATDLAKVAKIHIVGSDRTVQAVMNYGNTLGPAIIELVAKRVPLMIRKAAIAHEQTFIDAALAERKRFTAMLQQLNLDGITDEAKRGRILAQSAIATKNHEAHIAALNELWRVQLEDMQDIVSHSLALADRVTRLLPVAILAVRSEMELPLDAEWYAGLWSEQLANLKRVTENMLESLRKSSEQRAADQP